MGDMGKFLLGFLMVLMLTPGLVCGPFMGMGKAQAARPMMMDMPDCKGMGMDSAKETPGSDHIFFKDCSKTDLFSADQASLQKPNLAKVFFVAWADTSPGYIFTPTDFHSIRGPPPDWPDLSQTKPSILLTTQRIRE